MRGVWTLFFIVATYTVCESVDVCVVSAVDIHLHHFSKFLERHNISVQQAVMVAHGRRVNVTPDRLSDLGELTRGVIYITADLISSVRFLVRRHMAMEQARLLHGNERWFAAQTGTVVKKPLFYYSRLAEVNADKSRTAMKVSLGPEDERMYRILEYVNGYGVDPIGLTSHYHRWRAAAQARRLHVPIIFLHMHPSGIGERPYGPEVAAALSTFLGLAGRAAAHYLPTLDTKLHYDVLNSLRSHALDKKPFATRVLNGTAVLTRLSSDMHNESGRIYPPPPVDVKTSSL